MLLLLFFFTSLILCPFLLYLLIRIQQSVYVEAHAEDLPSWKQLQNLHLHKLAKDSSDENSEETDKDTSHTLLIQRKIVPLDSLNLALENQRQQRLLNAVGTQKHPLIVCASLISKVPNLGGIARTCEIFAASTLVLGDKSLTKMDNFKSLSVGAADWLDIEEVNEEVSRCVACAGFYCFL